MKKNIILSFLLLGGVVSAYANVNYNPDQGNRIKILYESSTFSK